MSSFTILFQKSKLRQCIYPGRTVGCRFNVFLSETAHYRLNVGAPGRKRQPDLFLGKQMRWAGPTYLSRFEHLLKSVKGIKMMTRSEQQRTQHSTYYQSQSFSKFFETKMSLKFVFVIMMSPLLTTISLAWDETDDGTQRRNAYRTLRMEAPLDLSANEQVLAKASFLFRNWSLFYLRTIN